jgi:DNA-binding CsgD family transcriptional regulator
MKSGERTHRVSVVNTTNGRRRSEGDEAAGGDGHPGGARPEGLTARLLQALDDVSAEVRDGDLSSPSHDGVLLDMVIGNIHVMVLEHIPYQQIELSPREQQIALMVARGRTNQAIASALEISVWTVSTHLRRIFAKLAVSSRAEMVAHLLAQSEFASQIGRTPLP